MKLFIEKIMKLTDGTALIEMALLLPVFLIMIIGTLDFGAAFARKMEIANAAKAGVQYASVNNPTGGDFTDVLSAINNNLSDSDNVTITPEFYAMCDGDRITWDDATCPTGTYRPRYVSIQISETYTTPFFNYSWWMDGISITEQTTLQIF